MREKFGPDDREPFSESKINSEVKGVRAGDFPFDGFDDDSTKTKTCR